MRRAQVGRDSTSRPSDREIKPRTNGASSAPTWNTSFEPGRGADLFPRTLVDALLYKYGLRSLRGEVLEYAAGTQDRTGAELEQILERSAIRDIVEQLSQKEAVEWFDSRRPERPSQPQPQPPRQPFTADRRPWNTQVSSPPKGLLPKPAADAPSKVSSSESSALLTSFKRIPKLRPISQISSDKRPIPALQSSERFGADSASEEMSVSVSRQHSEDELESSIAQSSRRDRIPSSDEERRSTGDQKQRDLSSDHSGITYFILYSLYDYEYQSLLC